MDPDRVPVLHQALKAAYGSGIQRNSNRLTALLRSLAGSIASLAFLLECRRSDIFPLFISRMVRIVPTGQHLQRLTEKLPRRLLRATIRDVRTRLAYFQKEVDCLWTVLHGVISDPSLWNGLVMQKDSLFAHTLTLATQRLERKFRTLSKDMSVRHSNSNSGHHLPGPVSRSRRSVLATTASEILDISTGSSCSSAVSNLEAGDQNLSSERDAPVRSIPENGFLDTTYILPGTTNETLQTSFRSLSNTDVELEHSSASTALYLTCPVDHAVVSSPDFRSSPLEETSLSVSASADHPLLNLQVARTAATSLDSAAMQDTSDSAASGFGAVPSASSFLDLPLPAAAPLGRPSSAATPLGRPLSAAAPLGPSVGPPISVAASVGPTFSADGPPLPAAAPLGLAVPVVAPLGPVLPVVASLGAVPVAVAAQVAIGPLPPIGQVADPAQFPLGHFVPVLLQDDVRLTTEVLNFSTKALSIDQMRALNLSTKFRQTPRRIPYLQLVTASEHAARILEESDVVSAEEFRTSCANIIRQASIPKSNLSVSYRRILRDLGNDENLVVTTADKGGKVVVLDQIQYSEMCLLHLKDPAYELVSSFGSGRAKVTLSNFPAGFSCGDYTKPDPADRLLRYQCTQLTGILNGLVRTRDLSAGERRLLIPGQPFSGTVPRFYGLPKVHKLGRLTLRPIIATCGSYSEKVLLKMKQILGLVLWGTTSVSNSYEFVRLLEQTDLQPSDRLLSFDVVSLYTRVPVTESLQIIESRLQELSELPTDPVRDVTSLSDRGIMILLRHVLEHCYFTWDSTLYRQQSGLPMGGRLSPIIANIFMEHLEHQVLCTALTIPKIYLRYVDDVFIVWDENRGSYMPFLQLLNAQHSEIVLTSEEEVNGTLPFLDVSITRPLFGTDQRKLKSLQLNIYRKPTFGGRYLHFKSSHPLKVKRAGVRGQWLRAQRILASFPVQRKRELAFLKRTYSRTTNGYPIRLLNKWFRQFSQEIQRNPNILSVRTRLQYEDIFLPDGQQIYVFPTAESRFQPDASRASLHSDAELDLRSGLATGSLVHTSDACDIQMSAVSHDAAPVTVDSSVAMDTDSIISATMAADATVGVTLGADATPNQNPRKKVMLTPFVPGISEKLQTLAGKYGLASWYTYPGKTSDLFTMHRGRAHPSKTQDCVYCTVCSCGVQYVKPTGT